MKARPFCFFSEVPASSGKNILHIGGVSVKTNFVVQDLSEIFYGAALVGGEWWDGKRIADGKLTNKDVLQKAAFHIYLWPGLIAALANAMGAFSNRPKVAITMEKLSTAFLFYLPMEIYHSVKALKSTTNSSTGGTALREAQQILRQRQVAGRTTDQDMYVPTPNPQPAMFGPGTPIVEPQSIFGGRGDLS